MKSAIIAFGSNLGNRELFFQKTLTSLRNSGIQITKYAGLIESSPQNMGDCKKMFLNTVILVKTELDPFLLLKELKKIEIKLGRVANQKSLSLPRTVDLDIIFYDDFIYESNELTIPHPNYHKRCFVLKPLIEIAPNWVDPILNITVKEVYQQCFFS